jgi:tetratricopeptide (TPR) repeat protein
MQKMDLARLEELLRSGAWNEARKLLETELRKSPNDHWLLTRLSSTYYEERNYRKALSIVRKALRIAPTCPLVQWDYAGALEMVGKCRQAIKVWEGLIKRGVNKIAYEDHGEGLRWARSLVNDCNYRIGLCYQTLGKKREALRYLRKHLSNRSSLTPSLYRLNAVKQRINDIIRKV